MTAKHGKGPGPDEGQRPARRGLQFLGGAAAGEQDRDQEKGLTHTGDLAAQEWVSLERTIQNPNVSRSGRMVGTADGRKARRTAGK